MQAPPAIQISGNRLLDALDRFDRAVARRLESSNGEDTELLNVASAGIREQLEAFIQQATETAHKDVRLTLRARILNLRKTGDDSIRVADTRRALVAAYWSHFENVDTQMKSAMDRNWRIFGRVISRQSLVALSRDLDDIRRRSIQLNTGSSDPAMLNVLAESQQRFALTLAQNGVALARSQGAQWLEQLQHELSEVISATAQLAQIDSQHEHGLGPFERGSQEVAVLVRSITESAGKLRPTPPPVNAVAVGNATPQSIGRISGVTLPLSAIPLATVRRTTETVVVPARGHGRKVIGSISAAVLFVLLVISIATVRSIVVPIRQFMITTERLASGDSDARFARGGIKELDALAVSFNQMAAALAHARAITHEYQGQLEVRVDERTRQLQHLAEHDPLTGLPNRRQLVSYLNASLQNAARTGTQVAVFFLDLDNFKNINDSVGHAFGDLVLKGIAQRLLEATRPGGFAARLGGDEFTVIYETGAGCDDVSNAGGELVHAFQKPLLVEGRELLVSVSVGASIYPDHERGPDALLRAADAALFHAKTSGRARLSIFSPELLQAASLKFSVEQGLRRAVERGEFELLFQPEANFEILGTRLVEALLRWRLPDGKYVSPADFLSVAEDSGLIVSISDWVLQSAIRAAAEWHHGAWPEAHVAINVSARQLLDTGFVARVTGLLAEYRLPPRCIEIELTETVLQTGSATIDVLHKLRQLDISVALDDFGTGYSSLASLEQLPLTRVKLDQSLIASIDTSARSLAIARTIVALCDSLGLEVTAEGVERPEQLALLLNHPAMTMQGYLISYPIEAAAVLPSVAGMPQRLQSLLLGMPQVETSTRSTSVAGSSLPAAKSTRS
ncbi:MAG: hypothetical protein JWM63_2424 [Gammaproteobacteria bacterium]|nr:hypothetical protein [Gammaproteobacteria bacterium]